MQNRGRLRDFSQNIVTQPLTSSKKRFFALSKLWGQTSKKPDRNPIDIFIALSEVGLGNEMLTFVFQ